MDFVVLDMEEDVNISIIFGRPFITTTGTIIDIKNGKLKFQIGKEEVEFNLQDMSKYPLLIDQVCSVDLVEELTQEYSQVTLGYDVLELCLTNFGPQNEECADKKDWALT